MLQVRSRLTMSLRRSPDHRRHGFACDVVGVRSRLQPQQELQPLLLPPLSVQGASHHSRTGTATASATAARHGISPACNGDGQRHRYPATVVGVGSVPPAIATVTRKTQLQCTWRAARTSSRCSTGRASGLRPTPPPTSRSMLLGHCPRSRRPPRLRPLSEPARSPRRPRWATRRLRLRLLSEQARSTPTATGTATALPATTAGVGSVPAPTATGGSAATASPAAVVGTGSVRRDRDGTATALPSTVVGTGSVPPATAMGNATAARHRCWYGRSHHAHGDGDSQDAVAVHLTGGEFTSSLFEWASFWFDADAGNRISRCHRSVLPFDSSHCTASPRSSERQRPPPTAMGNATAALHHGRYR
jgi:hypothetical protein